MDGGLLAITLLGMSRTCPLVIHVPNTSTNFTGALVWNSLNAPELIGVVGIAGQIVPAWAPPGIVTLAGKGATPLARALRIAQSGLLAGVKSPAVSGFPRLDVPKTPFGALGSARLKPPVGSWGGVAAAAPCTDVLGT